VSSAAVALPPINGPDDYIGRHGAAAFFALVDAAVPAARHRPVIVTTHMDLAKGTGHALDALVAANDPPQLFQLGDSPVRVEPHPDDGRPIPRELTDARVLHHLADAAQWTKIAKDGTFRAAFPPVAVARNILAAPTLPFPLLERIVEVPVFGPDGTLCAAPGYHPAARLLYRPPDSLVVPPIPADPTDAEVAAARTLIVDELLGDFPFVGDAERAHAVAALLLAFVRDLIPGPTPLHLWEKPTAGTGGSLGADVSMRPALGRALPTMTAGSDRDEWRKRLTAVLSESPIAVLFDNVRRLDSDDLAAALTATVWQDRPLGVSRVVHLPVRCVWLATANNPALTHEIVRRCVRIRLDAGTDRPWLREGFRHPDLIGWAIAHRGTLIGAALTLVQAWVARGRPAGTRTLGTFEEWSRVLGGVLETAQIPGFLANSTTFYEDVTDDETTGMHRLVAAWWARFGGQAVGVQQIWALTQGPDGVDLDLGDKDERSQRTRLGKLLSRMRDRIFDTRRLTTAAPFRRAAQWRLVGADQAAPPTEEPASFFEEVV
jgi:putative DNA primase/helicase